MTIDPTYIVLALPALMLTFYAQTRVKSAFARYNSVRSSGGVSAEAVSRALLDEFDLRNVRIERVSGNLTDHYDPRNKILRLSDSVGSSSSIAAIGVAAHEVGHAVQDREGYIPLRIRNKIAPVANLGSGMGFTLFFLGFLMNFGPLVSLGILLFLCALAFQIIALPVEFDASRRALALLEDTGTLTPDELSGAKSVLDAASLTYIATALMIVMQLLYLLSKALGRKN
jgi:Zn-dependent membrane protease YugP